MLGTFEHITKNFRIKPRDVAIDNIVFRLHYRATTLVLLAATAIVCSQQYIGDHISCIQNEKEPTAVPANVMNTFCFFTATFTIPEHLNATKVRKGSLPHPGVGPAPGPVEEIEELKRHNYYQWVPFILFGQAIAFYMPHYIWKRLEGGRVHRLTVGFKHAAYSILEVPLTAVDGSDIPSKHDMSVQVAKAKDFILERMKIDSISWSCCLVFCEILNVLNVIFQWFLTNIFLGRQFSDLGPQAVQGPKTPHEVNILDVVFPKVTKCTFHKFGPSGTIQAHDAVCIMAINIINEKIYVFLWYWWIIVGVCSVGVLFWRILISGLHSHSVLFNRWAWSGHGAGNNPWTESLTVTGEFHFCDWLFLYYLASNMEGSVFSKLFRSLAETLTSDVDTKLLIDINGDSSDYDDILRKHK